MQIILQQIRSETSGELAEMRVMQRRCFKLKLHNERRFYFLMMCWHLNWCAQGVYFIYIFFFWIAKERETGGCLPSVE